MGAQTQKKGGKQKGGGARRVKARRVEARRVRGPKFHACFSLSRSVLALLFSRWGSSRVFFSLSGGLLVFFFSLWVFSWNSGGVFEGGDPQMCTFGPSGCRVKAPVRSQTAGQQARWRRQPGGHDDIREFARTDQTQHHKCAMEVHRRGQPGGAAEWRSGEVQESEQGGQAQVQKGRVPRSVHQRGGGRTLFSGRERRECYVLSSTPPVWRVADGDHGSWTEAGTLCVKPFSWASRERNGRCCTASFKKRTEINVRNPGGRMLW